ncbi:MAG TPA: di-heme oxidoredictase family protein [Terriglobales bacterium]|nr:di-heme oxidoredictase family protein [Terriglobales bacterium]
MRQHLKQYAASFAALAVLCLLGTVTVVLSQSSSQAPTGFSTPTLNQNPGSQSVSNGFPEPAGDTFANDQSHFEEQDGVDNGLGPLYNAQSCVSCHQNPVTGGISQVTELRVGHTDFNGNFVNPTISINDGQNAVPNRSLVNDRATCAQAQERTPGSETIRTFRTSLNTLGDGFVEAIDSNTLLAIANNQPSQSGGQIAGEFIQVPVLEAPGHIRGGRFGWKNQQASLLSFSSDAYLNEQGITNRLNPTDTTTVCKTTTDPEDGPDGLGMADIDHFATFMRGTKAPPVDSALLATSDAQTGQQLFSAIGCNICHLTSITTAPAGTVINGGAFTVPAALGSKVIHPYSDFLLHDVGAGDGIVQNGPPDTANKMRTAPLWGMRTRDRLMHDGESLTRNEAILRHAGEATFVINNYRSLSTTQKNQLITFLNSL